MALFPDSAVILALKLLCAICCGTQKAETKVGKARSIWAPNAEESFRGLIYQSKVILCLRQITML